MTDKERVLKYLSGILSESERKIFERDLQNNANLKKQYEKITGFLDDLKTPVENVNEEYFVSLSEKARSRKVSKKKKLFAEAAFSLAAVAAVVLIWFSPVGENSFEANTGFTEFADEEVFSALDEYDVDDEFAAEFSFDKYLKSVSENIEPGEVEEYLDMEFAGLPAEIILENLQISENDIETIYNNLKHEKLL